MRPLITIIAFLAFLMSEVSAETHSCENALVTVTTFTTATAELICTATERAEILFAGCDLPPLATPVTIDIVTELEPGVAALFHRSEMLVEVLGPSLMEAGRVSDGAFEFLSLEAYFQSIIVHELTHATMVELPCPFDRCIVAQEYLAHAMQVMSLTIEEKAAFAENAQLDRLISRDEFSVIFLFIAPNRFTQKTWTHLMQQDDACAYIGLIIDETVLLDRERF